MSADRTEEPEISESGPSGSIKQKCLEHVMTSTNERSGSESLAMLAEVAAMANLE